MFVNSLRFPCFNSFNSRKQANHEDYPSGFFLVDNNAVIDNGIDRR